MELGARFGTTYTKIVTIQRRLAWPLCKDDTQIREAFHIFMTLRGGMGSEVGEGFRMGDTCHTHGGFMSMYGKNHYNIAK